VIAITDPKCGLGFNATGVSMAQNSPGATGPATLQALAASGSNQIFRKGQSLFRNGEPANGIFVIQQGQVNIFHPRKESTFRFIEPARAGAVLGLSECVSGRKYSVTAEAAERTTVSYIERHKLLTFLRQHCDLCMHIVRLLSEDLHVLYHELRHLSPSARHGRRKPPVN
jgi:CRP-like cAMP-binding protein